MLLCDIEKKAPAGDGIMLVPVIAFVSERLEIDIVDMSLANESTTACDWVYCGC